VASLADVAKVEVPSDFGHNIRHKTLPEPYWLCGDSRRGEAHIGGQLARLEAKLAMEILLDRFAIIALQEAAITWTDTYIVRGPKDCLSGR
jgi:hypothetical protein